MLSLLGFTQLLPRRALASTPMKHSDYQQWSEAATAWSAEYLKTLDSRPVRAQTQPGEIAAQIPPTAPEEAETMDTIMADFAEIIPPGMTHWQHPRFFAYFQSNAAPAAMIAEQLVSTMAAQCMLWQTSCSKIRHRQPHCAPSSPCANARLTGRAIAKA